MPATVFMIFMYICIVVGLIAILAGLIGLALNLIVYAYESIIGFDTIRKMIKEYRKNHNKTKVVKADMSSSKFNDKKEGE